MTANELRGSRLVRSILLEFHIHHIETLYLIPITKQPQPQPRPTNDSTTMPRRRKDSEENNNDDDSDVNMGECRNSLRSRSHSKKLHKLQKPIQRSAANARERSRMRVLSKAFSKLKTTLPWVPPDTKLSKLDTLRLASSYIAHLRQILEVEEEEEGHRNTYIHPLNLTWPFTFNGRTAALNEAKSPDPVKCANKIDGTTIQC